jgi:hypothetical protein
VYLHKLSQEQPKMNCNKMGMPSALRILTQLRSGCKLMQQRCLAPHLPLINCLSRAH